MVLTHNRLLVAGMSLVALAGSAAVADVNVTVDAGQTWLGYMNVFELPSNGGGYLWGSPWGTADLRASFAGDILSLRPNTNVYNPSDAYWVNPDGSGNKWMNANMYVENPGLIGQTVVFSGKTMVNSFVDGYTSRAFIKVLDPSQGYATIAETYSALVGGSDFSLSLAVPNTPGLIPQYGFVTEGADANPATADQLGHVEVAPIPTPAGALLLGLAGLAARRRRA